MGSLQTPTHTYLAECLLIESCCRVNNGFILHTVDAILRQLFSKQENFVLLLIDAARCMSVAGKTTKGIMPLFDACLLHCTLTT